MLKRVKSLENSKFSDFDRIHSISLTLGVQTGFSISRKFAIEANLGGLGVNYQFEESFRINSQYNELKSAKENLWELASNSSVRLLYQVNNGFLIFDVSAVSGGDDYNFEIENQNPPFDTFKLSNQSDNYISFTLGWLGIL
ncbi:MAG: hypothetical protein ABEH43_00915 [Flavobacteriales bacterium]